MAKNSIAQTLNNMQQTQVDTSSSSTALPSYTPGQINSREPDPSAGSQVLGSLIEFAKTGSAAFQEYDKYKTNEADTRSNEILAKLSPEERATALQNGTLLYQDDPWTMRALKQKIAQNAALMADNQIIDNINKGSYSNGQQLTDDMYNSRAQAGEAAARLNGFDFNDPDFQKGYSTNAGTRNLKIQETHAQWESGQIQKTKGLHDSVAISGFINTTPQSDPNITAQNLYDYIANSGGSYDDKVRLIGQTLNGLSGVAGGAQVIQRLQGMVFDLYGQKVNLDQVYGKEGMETFITKAGQSNYDTSRAARNSFNDRMAIALTSNDTASAQAQYQSLQAELDRTQPGQYDTPQRQQLEQLRMGILRKQQAQAEQQQEVFAKQAQQDNRSEVLYGQYVAAANGDTTAVTDYNAQSTNIASGNYTKEDTINAANQYYNNVMSNEQMSIDEKTSAVFNLASVTPKDQGINLILKSKLSQVSTELNAAGLKGNLDFGKTPNLNSMINLYKSNPGAMANAFAGDADSMKLYGQIATISGMADNGIDPTIFITGQQKMTTMNEIQKNDLRANSSKFFSKTSNDSRFKGTAGLPMQIATSVFENYYASTGDVDGASTAARQFLETNVIDIGNGESGSVGQVMKSSLQITPDVRSIKTGQEVLQNKVNDLTTQYPVLKGKINISTASDGSIMLTDPSGALRAVSGQPYIRFTRQDLMSEYQKQLDANKITNDKAVQKEEDRIRNNQGKQVGSNESKLINAYNNANRVRYKDSRIFDKKNDLGGLTD